MPEYDTGLLKVLCVMVQAILSEKPEPEDIPSGPRLIPDMCVSKHQCISKRREETTKITCAKLNLPSRAWCAYYCIRSNVRKIAVIDPSTSESLVILQKGTEKCG